MEVIYIKEYFIFSDVHSYYDELVKALTEKGFDENNPNHFIISLGDATDRGEKPIEVLQFLVDMHRKSRAILIKGNHEDLMEEAICRKYFESHDFHNCTHETVQKVTGCNFYECGDEEALRKMKENPLWNEYCDACVDYYELDNNIFVHGWIPIALKPSEEPYYKELPEEYRPLERVYDENWRNGDWKEARWLNGMKMWCEDIREPNKTIWCGHFHSSWGHSRIHDDGEEWLRDVETYYIDPDTGKQEPHCRHDPFTEDGIVAMDACTAVSGIVNVEVLEIKEENEYE